MMTETVSDLFQPNKSEVEFFLNTLFSRIPNGWEDALIEISDLYSSKFFKVNDLNDAIEYVVKLNQSGKNAYTYGSALHPDTKERVQARIDDDKKNGINKTRRSLATDFLYSNVCWVDLDEIINNEQFKSKYKVAPPNCYVVTSRGVDTMSVHFWWSLENPVFYKDDLETLNKGILTALGGDKGTHNCTRLMKIGGTVAWPKKSGRSTQMTKFKNTGQSLTYNIEDLKKAYPFIMESEKNPVLDLGNNSDFVQQNDNGWSLDDIKGMLNSIHPDSQYFDWLQIMMALHNEGVPFDVIDSWCSQGAKYEGSESIRSKLNSFTKGRGTTIGTLYYHAKQSGWQPERKESLITPISVAQETINPITGEVMQVAVKEPEKITPIKAVNVENIDLNNIPPREFVFGEFAARKFVSIIVAPPGCGKSIFTMQQGIRAALGENWGDWKCPKPLNVWVYNNEEGDDELKRRIAGAFKHMGIAPKDLNGNFYINSGEDRFITIAKNENGQIIGTPDYDALVQEIKEREIDYFIVDPFAETHTASENSNDEIKEVVRLYRKIAFDTNCAVMLVHHTRKGVTGNNEDNAGNPDTGRGGGAVTGVVRLGFTMSTMDKKEAEKLNVPEEDRRWYVRIDDAKANIKPPADHTSWLKFKSIDLDNGNGIIEGDSIGVLTRVCSSTFEAENSLKFEKENKKILQIIGEHMLNEDVQIMNISTIIKRILSSGYSKYSDRTLRTKIEKSVLKNGKDNDIIIDNRKCNFTYKEGVSRADGNKIILHTANI